MSDTTHNITSIDFVVRSLYESKFNEWLVNNDLNSTITKNNWKIKSEDLNIQLHLINEEGKAPFIKCKFHVGMMHVRSRAEFERTSVNIKSYTEKPELIGFLLVEPIQESDDLYLHFSYLFNILKELDVVEYLNLICSQLNEITSDIEFRLGVNLSDFMLEDVDDDGDDDDFEDDDDPFNNDRPSDNGSGGSGGGNVSRVPTSPYKGGE